MNFFISCLLLVLMLGACGDDATTPARDTGGMDGALDSGGTWRRQTQEAKTQEAKTSARLQWMQVPTWVPMAAPKE